MFLWYGRDFGPDDVAVMKWIAANMPTGQQANVNFFMLHVTVHQIRANTYSKYIERAGIAFDCIFFMWLQNRSNISCKLYFLFQCLYLIICRYSSLNFMFYYLPFPAHWRSFSQISYRSAGQYAAVQCNSQPVFVRLPFQLFALLLILIVINPFICFCRRIRFLLILNNSSLLWCLNHYHRHCHVTVDVTFIIVFTLTGLSHFQ